MGHRVCPILKKTYAKTGNFQVYYADVFMLSKRTKGAYQLIIIIGQL